MDTDFPQPNAPDLCPRCRRATAGLGPFCKCGFDLRYGTPKRPKLGACIYCTKISALTEEHLFANWISRRFPRRHSKTVHVLTRPEKYAFWKNVSDVSTREERSCDPYNLTVPNVCAGCNNGWMSTLHREAGGLVASLADGRDVVLSERDVILLARWVAMISINFECHGRILTATQNQRTVLMDGDVPDGFRISYALSENADWAGNSFTRILAVPIETYDGNPLTISSIYFCIERLAFHIFRSVGQRTLELGLLATGASDAVMPTRRLWPNFDPSATTPASVQGADLVSIQKLFGPVGATPAADAT